MHAVAAELVEFLKTDILRALAAHAGAGYDRRRLAQFGRPRDARIGHGFTRGYHRELREAVDEIGAPVVKIGLMGVAPYFGAVLKPHLRHVGRFDGADAGAARPQAFARPRKRYARVRKWRRDR